MPLPPELACTHRPAFFITRLLAGTEREMDRVRWAAGSPPKEYGQVKQEGDDIIMDHAPGRFSVVLQQGQGHSVFEMEQWV